ncbi:galactosyl transferase GMA12/MNN10 family protein [Variovorax sp. EL159]|nr:galactosyl transferase GMA12/MNN10 family protein [Variovorax sp. EL159]
MPLCMTFFERVDEQVLRNHAHYCRLYGYPHQWVESSHVADASLRNGVKYSEILRHLRTLAEGDWLLFLDGDSVVFRPVAVEPLMQGRDLLVVDGPSGLALTNMMILRNTQANRTLLSQMLVAAGAAVARSVSGLSEADRQRGLTSRLDEAALFRPAGMLGFNAFVADRHVNVSWRISEWFNAPVFVVSLASLPKLEQDGQVHDDMLHDLNLQRLLVRQVNAALMEGLPMLQQPAYPALSEEAMSSVNGHAQIAFVTLYTHHISTYARVSEHNVRRYCERHGYGYHVYRGIPGELDPEINGAWVKAWLLARHLAQHQWVVWVDADILFVNQAKRFEPLLEGRDLLFAKDVGGWLFNSGVMGFRNTARNAELLARIWARITGVEDKSSVYSSQGDQFHTNEVIGEEGLASENNILDCLSLNTPPSLATSDSLLVHFMSLGEPYRSVYMADMDAMSQRIR